MNSLEQATTLSTVPPTLPATTTAQFRPPVSYRAKQLEKGRLRKWSFFAGLLLSSAGEFHHKVTKAQNEI